MLGLKDLKFHFAKEHPIVHFITLFFPFFLKLFMPFTLVNTMTYNQIVFM